MTATVFGPAWFPALPEMTDVTSAFPSGVDTGLLDATDEEFQLIGQVFLAAGSGSKTFGTSGSKIDWNVGASTTFDTGGGDTGTLRVGVKAAADIATATGPPARATHGTAAFDVYDDLVAGTDTLTSTTWRSDAMTAGTPFTVNHGDLIAVCFHLTMTGTQSVKVRQMSAMGAQGFNFPNSTLLTSAGSVFTAIVNRPNVVLTFDDGTLGWLQGTLLCVNSGASETIGQDDIYGNQFTPTVPITVSAVAAHLTPAGTTNYDIGIWLASDPSAPIAAASVSVDPQQLLSASRRTQQHVIAATNLDAGTAYVVGVKQNSATAIDTIVWDQNATTLQLVNGLDANCFAVRSLNGAAFGAQNSSKRRCSMWFQASMFSDGAGGGGGGGIRIAGHGGLAA